MNFALRPRIRFASVMAMRAMFVRLMIILSVFMAGMHAPAIAHDDVGLESPAQCDELSVFDTDATNHGPESADVGGHAVHHHHCPVGLTSGVDSSAAFDFQASLFPPPGKSAALASHTTAPPLDPPLA